MRREGKYRCKQILNRASRYRQLTGTGFSPWLLVQMLAIKKENNHFCSPPCYVDPSGLEPELFWTKTRRVASYTTGQSLMSFR